MGSAKAVIVRDVDELWESVGLTRTDSAPSACYDEDWSVEPEVRELLIGIAAQPGCRTVVEIGSYNGDTILALATALEANGGGRAYAVERSPKRSRAIRWRARRRRLPVTVIARPSQDAFSHWGRESIDLLIIDGGHTFLAAYLDIAMWSSLLAPDGWMVVHDTVTRLHRRFPTDYFSCCAAFDIVDVVGMTKRQSHHAWEGVAIARWAPAVQDSIRHRHTSGGSV